MAESPVDILLVEDDAAHARLFQISLEGLSQRYRLHTVESLDTAKKSLDTNSFDLAFVDMRLPDGQGTDLLQSRDPAQSTPIIVLTSYGDEQKAVEAMKSGALDYFVKSTETFREMPHVIERALRETRLRKDRTQAVQAREESEQRYRSLIQHAPLCIHEIDLEGRMLSMNRAGLRMIRVDNESEIVGVPYLDFAAEDERDDIQIHLRQALQGKATKFEFTCLVNHERRTYASGFTPILDAKGAVTKLLGVTEDITARKRSEVALKDREEFFRAILEDVFEGIAIVDSEVKIQYLSPSTPKIIGYEPDELIGKNALELIHQDDLPAAIESLADTLQDPSQPRESNYRFVHKDGSYRYIEARTSNLLANSRVKGLVTHFRDVTDRKLAEDSLRIRNQAIEASVMAIALGDLESRITYANQAFLDLFGFDELSQVIGMSNTNFHSERVPIEEINRAMLEDGSWSGEVTTRKLDGTPIDIQLTAGVINDQNNVPLCTMVTMANITERKRAQRKLEESETKFRSLVENSFDVINMFTAEGELIYTSPSMKRVLGYEPDELVGKRGPTIVHPDDIEKATRMFSDAMEKPGQIVHGKNRLKHKDGTFRTVEVTGSNLLSQPGVNAMVSIFRDVTERDEAEQKLREREAQLSHISRLSTMGEMVAGIAHEINQPLSAISNFAQACSKALEKIDYESNAPVEVWLRQVSQQAVRCGQIIQRLRSFVTKRDADRCAVDLSNVIRDSIALIGSDMRRQSAQIDCHLPSPGPIVSVDEVEIQQVLVNLLRNAWAATRDLATPKIQVCMQVESDVVHLTVQDNGPGIDQQQHDSVFNPFYTTKDDGMGMGLAISKYIVEAHDGSLWLDRETRAGAKFHIELPLVTAPEEIVTHDAQ